MNIEEPTHDSSIHPLWRLAFRAGFLAAGSWAVIGAFRWLWWMHSPVQWDYQLLPNWWHAHEMLFGFAMPVVAGFLLTAVATWTGLAGTRGRRLQILFSAWLAARVVLWLAPGYQLLAWSLEMIFTGLLVWELGRRIFAVHQWRNVWFPPILMCLAAVDTAAHLLVDDPFTSARLFYLMVWLVTTLVVIIGGRVIPLFTRNRLGIRITPLPLGVEHLTIGVTLLVGVVMALGMSQDRVVAFRLVCALAAAIHFYRLWRWQGWKTFGVPLLWSMHLSYLSIPLTLTVLALVEASPVAEKHAMHLLAIGTIGGMVLAMMSRVALGHTGRPLEVPRYLALAFALVLLGGLARSMIPLMLPEVTGAALRLSAIAWIVAFGLFLWHYVPILTQPRADGKPD